MSSDNTRIPRDILRIVSYMRITDDWQLSIDPATTNPRFQNWGWKAADSTAWSGFRTIGDGYWSTYETKETRDTDTKKRLEGLVEDIVAYDDLNKLLDKISITPVPPADLLDFEKFRIKRGTPLEDKTPTHSTVALGRPVVNVVETVHLSHTLSVLNPDAGGIGKGKGIKDIQVWRALVAAGAAEPSAEQYTYVGDSSRGKFKSSFTDTQVRMDAWYKALLENTNGKKGDFCVAIKATVI